MLKPLNDEATALCVTAERAFLRTLEGSCRTPIGGLAELSDGQLTMRGEVLSPDGKERYRGTKSRRGGERHPHRRRTCRGASR